jgi:predicted Zn-dependent peptidase
MDEIIARVEGVNKESLMRLAQQYFQTGSIAVTVLGNLNNLKISRDSLAC